MSDHPVTLGEIDSRVAAATAGKWKLEANGDRVGIESNWVTGWRVRFPSSRNGRFRLIKGFRKADADLIAHAPTDLAAMSTELKALRAERERLREGLQVIADNKCGMRSVYAQKVLDTDALTTEGPEQ